MPEAIGTREEWQAARDELAKLEAEHAELSRKVTERRRQLPWVPVEKEYRFDTEDGQRTLDELFDGRSQLLAYNIMFGPDYENGACPGCSNLGDELDSTRVPRSSCAAITRATSNGTAPGGGSVRSGAGTPSSRNRLAKVPGVMTPRITAPSPSTRNVCGTPRSM